MGRGGEEERGRRMRRIRRNLGFRNRVFGFWGGGSGGGGGWRGLRKGGGKKKDVGLR